MSEQPQGLMSYSMLEDLLHDVVSTAIFKDWGNPTERKSARKAWNAALSEMFRMHGMVKESQAIITRLTIELAEEREKNRWIPVSEGLPKKDGSYLVQIEGCGGCDLVFFRKGRFSTFSGTTVTHYLPLPATTENETKE